MRLGNLIFRSIISLLLLSSCEKEKEEERIPVLTGITNSDMLYYVYNPPLELQLQPDSLGELKSGLDSIDIDLDGSCDLIINQRIFLDWRDDFNRLHLEEDNFPYIGLKTKNEFEVAYKWVEVNVGLGSFNSISLVDALPNKTRVDKIDNWSDSNVNSYFGIQNGQIWLWGAPPTLFWTYGTWYSLTNLETYVGIRKKTDTEYKFGWIKFKVYSRDKFEILSYAIEN